MRLPVAVSLVAGILAVGIVTPARTRHATAASSQQADIARALSAAPTAVAKDAAVVDMDDRGKMTTLRKGTNGWTCLPRDPGTPVPYPVCLDENGLAWYESAMTGKAPDSTVVGYSYMLQGGTTWSNTDPAATALPPGDKTPTTVPPHIMIMNARLASESGFPSGQAHPDTHKPFVMFGGTPYAIIIIPVK